MRLTSAMAALRITEIISVLPRIGSGLHDGTYRQLFAVSAAAWLLSACGNENVEKKPVHYNQDKRLAGRVEKVLNDSQFVLIRKYGRWSVLKGETVQSVGEGRSANLLPTGEELGEHIAADIRSGSAEVGDAVYIRKGHTN